MANIMPPTLRARMRLSRSSPRLARSRFHDDRPVAEKSRLSCFRARVALALLAQHEPARWGQPGGELAPAVQESVGSVANLKSQLNEAGINVQGSGWGALAWEPLGQRLVAEQVYDHQGNIGNGTVPLLVLDMWEHAYYLQYQNVKGDWVTAFWKVVNWDDVRQRFQKVRALDLGCSLR